MPGISPISPVPRAPTYRRKGPPTARDSWRLAGAALLFVAGFIVVFVAATASAFGLIGTLVLNRDMLQQIGGVLTIIMGLVFIGLIPMLQHDIRFHRPADYWHCRRTAARRDVRVWLDAVLGAHLRRRPFRSRRNARGHCGTWCAAHRRVPPGLWVPFVVLALETSAMQRWWGWLRPNTRRIHIAGGSSWSLLVSHCSPERGPTLSAGSATNS